MLAGTNLKRCRPRDGAENGSLKPRIQQSSLTGIWILTVSGSRRRSGKPDTTRIPVRLRDKLAAQEYAHTVKARYPA